VAYNATLAEHWASTKQSSREKKSYLSKQQGMKRRVTVMLSVLVDGRKLNPFVFLKKNNLPPHQKKKKIVKLYLKTSSDYNLKHGL
jgi:hypothetical protein